MKNEKWVTITGGSYNRTLSALNTAWDEAPSPGRVEFYEVVIKELKSFSEEYPQGIEEGKRKFKIRLPDINDIMSFAGLGSFIITLVSCLFLIATWAITYALQMWAVFLGG